MNPPEPRIADRRLVTERRSNTVRAVVTGGWRGRRRNPRRADAARPGYIDWHAPQWFAAALIVLLLSMADTFLTLVLINHGAVEINPLMAPFVLGGGRSFAFLKLALTAGAVTILVVLARVRAFGQFLAGPILVVTAILYAILIAYELRLLERVA